jgi:integrase
MGCPKGGEDYAHGRGQAARQDSRWPEAPVETIAEIQTQKTASQLAVNPRSRQSRRRSLRKMFNLAIRPWGVRHDNPAASFHRNVENEREVFLTMDEIGTLAAAIEAHPNRRAADVVRFILLTGARKGEARTARPDQFNLDKAIWTKPAATTKQRKTHRVPLSSTAVAFLRQRIASLVDGGDWLFPGEVEGKPIEDIRKFWADIQKKTGLPNVRVHDLRHTFASLLISGGASLPIVGKLLGHTQAKTTQRYVHLLDDPVRRSTEAVGDLLRPKLKIVDTDATVA